MFLKHSFTVRSCDNEPTEMLSMTKQDMLRMKIEFIECYDDLFTEGFKSLQKTMTIKLYAMEQC